MKVIVDTCVWSLALRRTVSSQSIKNQLSELIKESRVELIGPIRQEILSGISSKEQFNTLCKYLAAFSDFPITEREYESAAEYYNVCRQQGVQGSNTDFLICAAAIHYKMLIFTTDHDFQNFAKILPIKLLAA